MELELIEPELFLPMADRVLGRIRLRRSPCPGVPLSRIEVEHRAIGVEPRTRERPRRGD